MRILRICKGVAAVVSSSFLSFAILEGTVLARSVFLNGVDVSSSRSQELRNVQIRINEKGDIFISAPHYQVTEEDFFTPLSRVPGSAGTGNPGTPVAAGPGIAGSQSSAPVTASAPAPVAIKSQPGGGDAPVPAGAQPAKGDKLDPSSNAGAAKVSPESMPPVLPATPPAK